MRKELTDLISKLEAAIRTEGLPSEGLETKKKDRLNKALTSIKDTKDDWPFPAVSELIKSVKAASTKGSQVASICKSIDRRNVAEKESFQKQFARQLRTEADKQKLRFEFRGTKISLGPFGLTINADKANATLAYAKTDVKKNVPLVAAELCETANSVGEQLLATTDLDQLANEMETAIRVALALDGFVRSGEMRAALPAVHRAMKFVRTERRSNLTPMEKSYPVARFAVELSTLCRCKENLENVWKRTFRLETAVIDNTNDSTKSVFIPAVAEDGAGEGKFYQAIIVATKEQ